MSPSLFKWLFLASGGFAVACAPGILLAERFGWPQAPFQSTLILATLICLVSSTHSVWATRGRGWHWQRLLALVAGLLSGLWVAFVCFVLLTLHFFGMG